LIRFEAELQVLRTVRRREIAERIRAATENAQIEEDKEAVYENHLPFL